MNQLDALQFVREKIKAARRRYNDALKEIGKKALAESEMIESLSKSQPSSRLPGCTGEALNVVFAAKELEALINLEDQMLLAIDQVKH